MTRFGITTGVIDLERFRAGLVDERCGAYVQFEGWVRNHNEGQAVLRLEYEVYEPLAVKEGESILTEAEEQFGVARSAAIHRSGLMEIGEAAVVVGVASPHRAEAFVACRYIIDQLKTRLPIWKKEHYVSGRTEWVNCPRCTAHTDAASA